MDIHQLIAGRESVRSYDQDKPLARDVLVQILEAGRLAPSAANLQPWRFLLVSTEHMLVEVRKAYPRTWFSDAPHILVVVGDKDAAWKRVDGYNSIETDLAIAMDHMILVAESLGVATCWVGNFNHLLLRSVLQLADNEVVFALTPLGYPKAGFAKNGVKVRKAFDDVVTFI